MRNSFMLNLTQVDWVKFSIKRDPAWGLSLCWQVGTCVTARCFYPARVPSGTGPSGTDRIQPERQRYLALAILLEDMVAQPAVQQALWNMNDEDALATAEQFIGLSLAQRDGGTAGGLRLHDLQLDYVRAQYPDGDALDLIHGAVRLSSNLIDRARCLCQWHSDESGRAAGGFRFL